MKTEFKKDKIATVKDLKVEIKQWKKSLGLERSQKIKLDKKLVLIEASRACSLRDSSSATSIPTSKPMKASEEHEDEISLDETCSICARPIPNYIPRYSSGLLWNPACSDCIDASEDDIDDDTPG